MSGGAKKIILVLSLAVVLGTLSFFGFLYQVSHSHGSYGGEKIFTINKGDSTGTIALNLEKEGLISNRYFFLYYCFTYNLKGKIIADQYKISSDLTIPEIAKIITSPISNSNEIEVTFPEGFTLKEMAQKLDESGLPGDDFLKIASNVTPDITSQYDFLSNFLTGSSLEGFLFPDTYYFYRDSTGENIVSKMLDNFNSKLTPDLRSAIQNRNESVYDIVTMASIIEKEGKTDEDKKIISGVFWNRIESGQALQSDATLSYALGEDSKTSHSIAETQTSSPYNTYLNKGLPKGPICNPGLVSIEASIYPEKTDYNYFLTDPQTGETIFAKTFAEHTANKQKYGL